MGLATTDLYLASAFPGVLLAAAVLVSGRFDAVPLASP